MPINDARAFCLFGDDLAGIGLSNEDQENGRIFSLFHEVCHLAVRQPGVSGLSSNSKSFNQALEQYCDRFAASFLLPASSNDVIDSLKQFGESTTINVAREIAQKFKVSKYVVLRRTLDLGYINSGEYWNTVYNWREIDSKYKYERKFKESGHGNYNVTQISHIGKRFIQLIIKAINNDYLTPIEATRMIGLDTSVLELNL